MVGVLGIEPRLASSKPAVISHYTIPQQIDSDAIDEMSSIDAFMVLLLAYHTSANWLRTLESNQFKQ